MNISFESIRDNFKTIKDLQELEISYSEKRQLNKSEDKNGRK